MQNRVAPRAKMSTAGYLENSEAASLFMKSSGDMKARGQEGGQGMDQLGRVVQRPIGAQRV